MESKKIKYYEEYLKLFPDDYSIIVQIVKTLLHQEARIAELEKKT